MADIDLSADDLFFVCAGFLTSLYLVIICPFSIEFSKVLLILRLIEQVAIATVTTCKSVRVNLRNSQNGQLLNWPLGNIAQWCICKQIASSFLNIHECLFSECVFIIHERFAC